MFGPAGLAYVYLVYGMYDCLNVVSGPDGAASAVLVRAIEPIEGIEAMVQARTAFSARRKRPATTPVGPQNVASGPGRLCAALGIDRSFTGVDLCDSHGSLHLEPASAADRAPEPAWTPRIGVAYAGEPWASLAWRLVDRTSTLLSGPIPEGARGRPDPDPQPGGTAHRSGLGA